MRKQFAASATVRAMIARSLAGAAAPEFAARRWGAASEAAILVHKAGVSGLEVGDFGTQTPDSEFFGTVFDALPFSQGAWRRVGFYRRLLSISGRASAAWIGQSKAIPVSRPTIVPASLASKKVGAITIQTKEALEDPLSEPLVEHELRAAAVGAVVQALLDPANAGDADTPASITHSSVATNIPATSEPGDDIAGAIAAFGGDLSAAIWLLDPLTAAQLALARDAGGNYAFPNIGLRGGSILGAPALVYRDAPRDTNGGILCLADPTGIAYGLDSIRIERASAGAIEADTEPTGASDTPAAATATLISLFQNDLIAHKIIVEANWDVQRPGGVVAITGTNYATSTP